jgi:hypothetical protein
MESHYAGSRYAECHILYCYAGVVMLNVISLNVVLSFREGAYYNRICLTVLYILFTVKND